jgi:hypothetical protein
MVLSSAADKQGKIVCYENIGAPYDKFLLQGIAAGARALVVLRDRTDTPGQGMFYVKLGSDQSRINVPVVEIMQPFENASSIHSNWVGSSLEVSLWPEENEWKKANEKTAFQVVWNVILSGMEVSIIGLSLLRLRAWVVYTEVGLKAIAPVCIILEAISAMIRLAATIVDPFLTFRTMPSPIGELLVTISFPFQFSSGILLTFFWAETLTTNQIKAAPFISKYKKSALVIIALLFIGEIVTSTSVLTVAIKGSFSPVYVSQAFYVLVAIVLTICYFVCAYQITKRLNAGGGKRKRFIRALTLRFLVSTAGYIMFIILVILFIPYFGNPWGFKIICNLMFFSANLTGIIQVYAFHPPKSAFSSQSEDNTNSSRIASRSTSPSSSKLARPASMVRSGSEFGSTTRLAIESSTTGGASKDKLGDGSKSDMSETRLVKPDEVESSEEGSSQSRIRNDLSSSSSSSNDSS